MTSQNGSDPRVKSSGLDVAAEIAATMEEALPNILEFLGDDNSAKVVTALARYVQEKIKQCRS